jgi:hypothetical protein
LLSSVLPLITSFCPLDDEVVASHDDDGVCVCVGENSCWVPEGHFVIFVSHVCDVVFVERMRSQPPCREQMCAKDRVQQ